MSWAEIVVVVVAVGAVGGVTCYLGYLLFLLVVLIKYGTAGVERVAKVVPALRWIEAVASAITAVAGRQPKTDSTEAQRTCCPLEEDRASPAGVEQSLGQANCTGLYRVTRAPRCSHSDKN